MANRKEDEKNEKIIRGLLKLPGNRKCINCNILGPQYVCTTFSTFVCTTCGGIHREFTHRVKSVSMAKFTPQEIVSLQAGGNERAKEIYFKEWDPQRQSAPDSSNVDKLRDFIKHVYVDRRYSGERGSEKPPRGKLSDKDEPNENRRSDGYLSGSRSPTYDDRIERRYSDRSSPGYDARRSPGYDHDPQRHSDYGRSPVRSGIVNDWRREDRFSNGRNSDDRRSSDGEGKLDVRSPDNQKDAGVSSLPTVRPVGEILGENVVPLRISEPPKANSSRVVDGSKITQRTGSSSSLASTDGIPVEPKKETSLINFDAEPEPPVTVTAVPQSSAGQSVPQSTSTQNDDNWACFDSVPDNKVPQAPQSTKLLESVLSDLFVPALVHSSGSISGSGAPVPSNGILPSSSGDLLFASVGTTSVAALPGIASVSSPLTSLPSQPSGGAPVAPSLPSTLPAHGGGAYQQPGMQHHQQVFTHSAANQQAPSQLASVFPNVTTSQDVAGNSVAQPSQAVSALQSHTIEANLSQRKELPVDLFTATYSFSPYQAPGWRAGVSGMYPGMGYQIPYNPAMSMQTYLQPTYQQPTKSSNPFDAEGSSVQATPFPSMSSLHTALPNATAPIGVAHASNLGTTAPSWMRPQLSTMAPPAPSFGPSMPTELSGMYIGQQLPNNMASSRPQGLGSSGNEGPAFGLMNPPAAMPNPSVSGNPFG